MSARRQDLLHKAYVRQFDQKGMPVMLMHRGDSWSYSQKGHSHTYFHAQSGASCYQFSGYIYTSFQKTAKIWWDPWQGGDGAICSTIDGSGSGYPIAEVNNCSRVIKYVVTVGQRFSSCTLVDMRIHDINVVADLTRHNPTAPDPEQNDGAGQGSSEFYGNTPEALSWLAQAEAVASQILTWWEGLRPVLHLMLSFATPGGGNAVLHFSLDLIGNLQFHDSHLSSPVIDQLTPSQRTMWAQHVGNEAVREGRLRISSEDSQKLYC